MSEIVEVPKATKLCILEAELKGAEKMVESLRKQIQEAKIPTNYISIGQIYKVALSPGGTHYDHYVMVNALSGNKWSLVHVVNCYGCYTSGLTTTIYQSPEEVREALLKHNAIYIDHASQLFTVTIE